MIWPLHASLPAIVGVLTVLGNDARYVVSVHPSCRGAKVSPLGQFSVPPIMSALEGIIARDRRFCGHWRKCGRLARIFPFFLQGLPFQRARGRIGWGGLRLALLRSEDLLGLLRAIS